MTVESARATRIVSHLITRPAYPHISERSQDAGRILAYTREDLFHVVGVVFPVLIS